MAQIGWIDFSPEHRDRVAAVLEMMKPEGVLDELGIGSIRDAFADRMFPGISTIQTRAKYFFLIPYCLYEYQRLTPAKKRATSPEKYLENLEYDVMWELAEKYEHKEGTGVIGITKRKPEKIMRRPSAVYWNGLSVYNLIPHDGLGVRSYLRSRGSSADSLIAEAPQGDDVPRDDADADHANQFQLKLPYEKDWRKTLTLDLTRSEAGLLADRIRAVGSDFLICALMEDRKIFDLFSQANGYADFARLAVQKALLSSQIQSILIMAHDFSELMYGAHCAYNCILQKNKFGTTTFEKEYADWVNSLRKRMLDYKGFSVEAVLDLTPRISPYARKFVNDWWTHVTSEHQTISLRNKLIVEQESNTKRHKARVNQNRYDDVSEDKWVGLSKFEYRKAQVTAILKDVYAGLKSA